MKNKKLSIVFIIIIFFVVVFYAYRIGYESGITVFAKENGVNKLTVQKLMNIIKIWNIVSKNYVEPQKLNADKAVFEASRGVVKSIGDPYADLFAEQQKKIFEEDLQGSFGGVGFEIGIRKEILTVIAPLEGTPAEKVGLKPGDRILKINGTSTEDMPLDVAVSLIRGIPGTTVTLTIYRSDWIEPKDFIITREIINIPLVKSKIIDQNVGYIKINSFANAVDERVKYALIDLKRKGADRFIIDLRNNPGGFLEMAVKVSSLFLTPAEVVVIQKDKNKTEKVTFSEGPGSFRNEKIVILINSGSASASEIFAGALRDNLNVKLIGEKSFGKGSVQQTFNIDKNLLKLTIAHWYTPKGSKIEGEGLKPDIEFKEDKKELLDNLDKNKTEQEDKILNYAVAFIKKM